MAHPNIFPNDTEYNLFTLYKEQITNDERVPVEALVLVDFLLERGRVLDAALVTGEVAWFRATKSGKWHLWNRTYEYQQDVYMYVGRCSFAFQIQRTVQESAFLTRDYRPDVVIAVCSHCARIHRNQGM